MFNRSRPQLRVCARPVHIGLLAALLAAAALSLETQSSEAVTDGTPGSNHRQAFAENAAYEIPAHRIGQLHSYLLHRRPDLHWVHRSARGDDLSCRFVRLFLHRLAQVRG